MSLDEGLADEEVYDPNAALLRWSEERPDWQRDLLRRLTEAEALTDAEREQVIGFILSKDEIIDVSEGELKPIPITIDDFPKLIDEGDKVALKKISDLSSAGAMAANQELLFDLTKKLHIIYGDNGSGKSGYSKVLRRSTGAQLRNESFIYGNVFDDDFSVDTRARAKITVTETSDGASNDEEVPWEDGDDINPLLSSIKVFDNATARISVNSDCEVAFLPFSLNLLERLGSEQLLIDDKLKQIIQNKKDIMGAEWMGLDNDAVITCLSGELSKGHSDNQIEKAILWKDSYAERLSELKKILSAGDAAVLLNSSRLAQTDKLERQLSKVSELLSSKGVGYINEQIEVFKAAVEARRLLGAQTFENIEVYPLDGTGGNAWRILFGAAKEFIVNGGSEDRPFPPTSKEDHCPLCQQELDDDALGRFQVFNNVVYGQVVIKADEARNALDGITKQIEALEWSNDLVDEVLCCLVEDEGAGTVCERDAGEQHALSLWSNILSSAKEVSIAAIDSGNEVQCVNVDATSQMLSEIKIALTEEKLNLLAALDEEERVGLEKELKLLEARKKLDGKGASILAIRDALLEVEKYTQASAQLGSRVISIIKGKVRSIAFDGPYTQVFKEILRSLDVKVKATIGFKENNAKTYRSLELGKATEAARVKIDDVLSEGEHRALALAGFFTEVHHVTGNPTIVIDDPVSSLDHLRRGKVAKCIVELSKTNQVVVFTHDLSFLFDLRLLATSSGLEPQVFSIKRDASGCGVVDKLDPAKAMNVKKRLNALEQDVVALKDKHDIGVYGDPEENDARRYGSALRDIIEAMVEHEVLNGVVKRFGTAVHTQSLRGVPIPEDIYTEITKSMSITSAWCHEDPQARNLPPPMPDELFEVVSNLEDLLKIINDAKNDALDNRPKLP